MIISRQPAGYITDTQIHTYHHYSLSLGKEFHVFFLARLLAKMCSSNNNYACFLSYKTIILHFSDDNDERNFHFHTLFNLKDTFILTCLKYKRGKTALLIINWRFKIQLWLNLSWYDDDDQVNTKLFMLAFCFLLRYRQQHSEPDSIQW